MRPLFLADRPGAAKPLPAINLSAAAWRARVSGVSEVRRRGACAGEFECRSCLPHLSFVDMGGHGYATVRAGRDAFETEFVCIPRPLERSSAPDGGPLLYQVTHRAELWRSGERPKLVQSILEGKPDF